MQINIKDTNFKPFTVEITFESESEANNFWHRMNVANEVIAMHNDGYEFLEDDNSELWENIDGYYKPKVIEEKPKTFEYNGHTYKIKRLDSGYGNCVGCYFDETGNCPDDSIFNCRVLESIAVEVTS
jgi:hypothetical protein